MFNKAWNERYRKEVDLPNGKKGELFGHWNDLCAFYYDGENYWSWQNNIGSKRFVNQGERPIVRGWTLKGVEIIKEWEYRDEMARRSDMEPVSPSLSGGHE